MSGDSYGSGAERARDRADAYAVLAAAFDGDVEVLAVAMKRNAFDPIVEKLPGEVDVQPLRRDDPDREALRLGYDNLFVVPGPHYVPPFASAHADEPSEAFESDSRYHDDGGAGELFGSPAVAAAAHYERFDFSPTRGDGIPDHVAAEFEFVAALAQREATLLAEEGAGHSNARRELRRAQTAFLNGGLDWLEAFHSAVERRDDAEGVFAAIAGFAANVVHWDERTLTDAVDPSLGADRTSG